MKKLESKLFLILRIAPVLLFFLIVFDALLFFVFEENREIVIKIIALSFIVFFIFLAATFFILNLFSKKMIQFSEIIKNSIEKKEFCSNTTKIGEFDAIAEEVNKLLDNFFKNSKNLRALQEKLDSTTKDLKLKVSIYEEIINNQKHGIAVFKSGILDFANSYLLNILNLPNLNEFHKNKYRLLDYFERSGEQKFYDGYQDDSWCFALTKDKKPQVVRMGGNPYILTAFKLSSDDSIIIVSFSRDDR